MLMHVSSVQHMFQTPKVRFRVGERASVFSSVFVNVNELVLVCYFVSECFTKKSMDWLVEI